MKTSELCFQMETLAACTWWVNRNNHVNMQFASSSSVTQLSDQSLSCLTSSPISPSNSHPVSWHIPQKCTLCLPRVFGNPFRSCEKLFLKTQWLLSLNVLLFNTNRFYFCPPPSYEYIIGCDRQMRENIKGKQRY